MGGLDPLIPMLCAGLATLLVGVLCVDPPSEAAGAATALPRCARGVVIALCGVAPTPARGGASSARGGTQPNRLRPAAFSGVRNGSLEGVGAGDSGFRFRPDAGGWTWMASSGGRPGSVAATAATSGASPAAFSSLLPASEAEAFAGVRRRAA